MKEQEHQEIRQLFDDYLRMYATRDDGLTEHFSDDFSGFTGGGNLLVKDRDTWVAITRQDFAEVKEAIRIELKDLAIQSLADTVAVATGFFTIHLPIEDHVLSRETARLVLIFHKESAGWKISHSSISIPYALVGEGEVYPMKELVERNRYLEELIAQRTAQLSETNESLTREIAERKQHEKERLNIDKLESLGALAGGIAHDFNNILSGITGNISLAQVFLEPSHKACKPLAEAEKASTRAAELARQLLTFARGGQPVKKVINLQHLLKETLTLVLRGSNVKRALAIAGSINAVEADEGQLNQVIHNIAINAIQAMPGGGTLAVNADNQMLPEGNALFLPAGSYVRLTFSDQGCGIPEEDMNRIFDPYFTTKSSGRGLGLASVHSIVKRHGGHIGVRSQTGKGTTVTIHLPSIPAAGPGQQTESSQTGAPTAGGSVLVMDDEEIIREMTSDMLDFLGYQATAVENGADAVVRYRAAKAAGAGFSAVILDLTIPGGMGGKEAAQQILAIDPQACLIVSSGYSDDPIISDYGSYGFRAAIAKPYKMAEFGQLLHSVLSGSPAGDL
jgi:signal transduction histidine kinase